MSNLKTAVDAIKAELAHVKSGLHFYHSRAKALEEALANLVGLSAGHAAGAVKAATPPVSQKAPATAKKAPRTKAAAKETGSAKAEKSALPSTGGDFWISLVTEQPQSAPDILKAATAKIGTTPSREDAKKLLGRQTFTLNALIKQQKIQDSGKGRARRFFKK